MANLPFFRSPVLVPSAAPPQSEIDRPPTTDTARASPGSGTIVPLEVHASEESDWESETGEPPRQWRPQSSVRPARSPLRGEHDTVVPAPSAGGARETVTAPSAGGAREVATAPPAGGAREVITAPPAGGAREIIVARNGLGPRDPSHQHKRGDKAAPTGAAVLVSPSPDHVCGPPARGRGQRETVPYSDVGALLTDPQLNETGSGRGRPNSQPRTPGQVPSLVQVCGSPARVRGRRETGPYSVAVEHLTDPQTHEAGGYPSSAPADTPRAMSGERPITALPRSAPKRSAPGTPSSGSTSPVHKRKKKAKKTAGQGKKAGAKGKSKPPKKSGKKGKAQPDETQLLALMSAMAERYGWPPSQPAPAPPGFSPPTARAAPIASPMSDTAPLLLDRPASRQQPTPARRVAPASLGAPPGEETWPQAPPLLARGEPEDPSVFTIPDWSSQASASPLDSDSASMVSGATSLHEIEAPPGMRRLGEEAEALLLRYLGEFYADPPADSPKPAQHSMLFRKGTEQTSGIPLTPDFIQEYERLADETPPRGAQASLARAFAFKKADTDKYFATERLSPELLALGDHLTGGNPLRRRPFLEKDKEWCSMATFSRNTMRLAAYAGALANLAVQAEQLNVSPEDRALIDSLSLSIAELQFRHSTRAAFTVTRHRRDHALSVLGFGKQQRQQLTRSMPFTGPFLFSGQFTPRVKAELAVGQQARELAGQLRRSRPPVARSRGYSRPMPYPLPGSARRGGGPPQSSQRGHKARKPRGRAGRGKTRGQRGQSKAAPSRGGF